jgi:hypothetical protein
MTNELKKFLLSVPLTCVAIALVFPDGTIKGQSANAQTGQQDKPVEQTHKNISPFGNRMLIRGLDGRANLPRSSSTFRWTRRSSLCRSRAIQDAQHQVSTGQYHLR